MRRRPAQRIHRRRPTGHAQVIAQGVVSFGEGAYAWTLGEIGVETTEHPLVAETATFLLAGDGAVHVHGTEGTWVRLAAGEATFRPAGSTAAVQAGEPATVGAIAVGPAAAGQTGAFTPGAGAARRGPAPRCARTRRGAAAPGRSARLRRGHRWRRGRQRDDPGVRVGDTRRRRAFADQLRRGRCGDRGRRRDRTGDHDGTPSPTSTSTSAAATTVPPGPTPAVTTVPPTRHRRRHRRPPTRRHPTPTTTA